MELEVRDLQFEALRRELIQRVVTETAQCVEMDLDRLSLALLDDEQIQEVNERFRNVDGPTDVIAFEAEAQGDELVGEVIVSVETARRQAEHAGHSLDTELAWLIAHGVLHVAGMSDETESDLEDMLVKQREVMRRLGLEAR